MKKITQPLIVITCFFLIISCGENKKGDSDTKQEQTTTDTKTTGENTTSTAGELNAPDFTDPELKKYYGVYTDYMKRVVASIQANDSAATMKMFREEGSQFMNKNDMDKKAQDAEPGKFTTWLMQTMPYQKIIVGSESYKKFNEEYYKKVKDNFEKKGL